jgi:hypothetical protein
LSDSDVTLAWHFLPDDGRMRHGKRMAIKAGTTYRVKPPLSMCEHGLHASIRPLDALSYAPGSLICRVELGGEILTQTDKVCAQTRKVLWMADATNVLHEFSAWSAEWILDNLEGKGYKIDPRSRAAITAKRAWLRGEISNAQLAAAGAAAWGAAWDAWDAWAARAAAWAAGAAAWGAAWDAAWAVPNSRLEEMLMELAS